MIRLRWLVLLLLAPAETIFGQDFVSVFKNGPGNAAPGTDVSFDVQIGLPNGTDATNVVLTDNVPLQTTFVSAIQTGGADVFTCTTPAVGASTGTINCSTPTLRFGVAPFPATFVFTFHASSLAQGSIDNTANVSATGDTNPLNNSASDSAGPSWCGSMPVPQAGR